MNLEEYIRELSPELQEKARACESADELLSLAKEAGVAVPDEALEAIAGGREHNPKNCRKMECPKCGSTNLESWPIFKDGITEWHYKCKSCGHEWDY